MYIIYIAYILIGLYNIFINKYIKLYNNRFTLNTN